MNYEKRNQQILDFVRTHSEEETARFFNLSQSRIHQIVKSNGLKLKKSRINLSKLNLDIDYFKEINTPKKAYWLGFICADGYILGERKLSIFVKDLEILEKFKKDINSEHKISTRSNFDSRTRKIYSEYCLQIGNEIFVKYLTKWVTHNKTDILEFPEIEEKYYPYFIAGLFDGDGSVCIKKLKTKYTLATSLISTKEVLDYIQNLFLKKFNITPKKLRRVTENKNNVWVVHWGITDSFYILNYIYCDSPEIYLSRKYNRFKLVLGGYKTIDDLICHKSKLKQKQNRRKLSISRRRFQPVLQYSSNGTFIKKFDSMLEASAEIKVSNGPVCAAAKRKIRCKNYYWIKYNGTDPIIKNIDIKIWKTKNKIVEKVLLQQE